MNLCRPWKPIIITFPERYPHKHSNLTAVDPGMDRDRLGFLGIGPHDLQIGFGYHQTPFEVAGKPLDLSQWRVDL